jgi:hypothetical protein
MGDIKNYFGTYIGFCPTDESKIGLGEFEMTFNEQGISSRHATGHKIDTFSQSPANLRALTEAEVIAWYVDGSEAYKNIDGFQLETGAVFLFTRSPEMESPRLIVRLGEFIELLGPTFLFDAGEFEEIVSKLTVEVGAYPFPRLQYEGRHEPRPA